ncbi:MAG: hypothetical protein ACUZ8H_00155 [Candidatus Anammoxibacter sp.]
MKRVSLYTRVYYIGSRFLPFLEHQRYGKFPLNSDGDVQYFDKLPTQYAKVLVENTPAMFSLEKANVSGYDDYEVENLKEYAKKRGLNFHPSLGRDKLVAKLIALDKQIKPEQKADALK